MKTIYEQDPNEVRYADHYEVTIEQTNVSIGFNAANWIKSRKMSADPQKLDILYVVPQTAIVLPHSIALALAKKC